MVNSKSKDTGVIRCIDNAGRLVIPIELRRELGLLTGEPVHMFVEDGRVVVEKYRKTCFICGKPSKTYSVLFDKKVCDSCKAALNGVDLDTESDDSY